MVCSDTLRLRVSFKVFLSTICALLLSISSSFLIYIKRKSSQSFLILVKRCILNKAVYKTYFRSSTLEWLLSNSNAKHKPTIHSHQTANQPHFLASLLFILQFLKSSVSKPPSRILEPTSGVSSNNDNDFVDGS